MTTHTPEVSVREAFLVLRSNVGHDRGSLRDCLVAIYQRHVRTRLALARRA